MESDTSKSTVGGTPPDGMLPGSRAWEDWVIAKHHGAALEDAQWIDEQVMAERVIRGEDVRSD